MACEDLKDGCLRINKDSTGVKQLGDGITKECIIYCDEIIYSVSVQYFLIKGLAAPTGLDGRDSVDAVQEPILLCGVELLNPRVLSGAVWILFNYTLFPASAGSFLPTIYCFSIVNLWLVLFHAKRAMEDDRVRMAVENRNSRAQAEFINNEDDDDPLGELPPVRGRIGGPTRRSSKGGWTPEEDETLRRAVQCFKGKHWKKIAEFFPDRTDVQCLHRWQKVLNPELIKGPWTKEEDESIVELVNRHGAKKSSSIVKNLPGHIGKQCCERRMGYGRTDLLEMDMASHQMFSTFMAKATQFEELGKLGGELLARFHQELDLFRRPPLNETSKILANIIQSNQTERLRTYVDAGCRHFHVDAQVTIKLNDSLQGLMKHVEQAQELLKDLDCIFNKATSLMKEATSLMMQDVKISDEEHNIEDSSGTESDEGSILNDQKLELSDYVSMMSVVYGMLRQDYAMQEKVVSDLQLNTPSEILQTYCFMWTLRPFVDERIVNEALVWI